MGYRAHKIEAEEKEKRIKRILFSIGVFLLLAVLVFSVIVPPETWKYYVALPEIENREEGELRIHFIDVGQGDCTLVELPDGKVTMIDVGDDNVTATKQILRYLNALEIEVIDYLIITHEDADHCGGVEDIVKLKKVVNAYLPTASKTSNPQYAEAYTALADTDCNLIEASRLTPLGGTGTNYTLAFLYPYGENDGEDEGNKSSSVVWLDYMGMNALFMGDASDDVESLLLRDDKFGFLQKMGVDLDSIEILKVAHHGSGYSSSAAFLQYLGVQTAVVSCGKDNPYGHPSNRVINDLTAVGASVYRTDKDGHVIITISNNKTIETITLKD